VTDDRDDPLFGPPDEPNVPSAPTGGPTEPIRPADPGTAPIPDRVRQPIVVPHKESMIGGLPRPFVIAAVVALAIVFVLGLFIGRASNGEGDAQPAAEGGRRAACERALALSLQVSDLQRQALANRTQAAQALAVGDEAQVQELNSALEPVAAAIQDSEAQLTPAVERCQTGGGGAKGGGKGKGGAGKGDGKA
jgi:hypothetical protein